MTMWRPLPSDFPLSMSLWGLGFRLPFALQICGTREINLKGTSNIESSFKGCESESTNSGLRTFFYF